MKLETLSRLAAEGYWPEPIVGILGAIIILVCGSWIVGSIQTRRRVTREAEYQRQIALPPIERPKPEASTGETHERSQ